MGELIFMVVGVLCVLVTVLLGFAGGVWAAVTLFRHLYPRSPVAVENQQYVRQLTAAAETAEAAAEVGEVVE